MMKAKEKAAIFGLERRTNAASQRTQLSESGRFGAVLAQSQMAKSWRSEFVVRLITTNIAKITSTVANTVKQLQLL